jgi:hypothetical protein
MILLYFPNSSILTTAQLKKNTLWQMHIAAQLAHGLTYLLSLSLSLSLSSLLSLSLSLSLSGRYTLQRS